MAPGPISPAPPGDGGRARYQAEPTPAEADRASSGGDRARAEALWRAALERRDHLDLEGALSLLERATEADPTFLKAHSQTITILRAARGRARLRRLYAPWLDSDQPFRRCLAVIATAPEYLGDATEALLDIEAETGRSECTASLLLRHSLLTPASRHRAILESAALFLSEHGDLDTELAAIAANELGRAGHEHLAARLWRQGLASGPDATSRVYAYQILSDYLLEQGRATEAEALRRALAAAVARDGRPGPALLLGAGTAQHPELRDRAARMRIIEEMTVVARGAGLAELETLGSIGMLYGDHLGEPARAAEVFSRAAWIADTAGMPEAEVWARIKLGRALGQTGRLAEAEAALLRAREEARGVGDRYLLGDMWHDLAHIYEAASRWPEAVAAVDSFVAAVAPLRHSPRHVISLYDAGTTYWKAGLHEASRRAFREMVRAVDRHERQYYWAGENSEREGDLEAARRYYRLALVIDGGTESVRAWAGLVRVYERLGQRDSARAAAAAHDSLLISDYPGFIPLLPGLYGREGRMEEALRTARAWLRRHETAQNLRGVVSAQLQLADLLLAAGRPLEAAAAAGRAERGAAELQLVDERIEALRLGGRAFSGAGRREDALRLLLAAARLAELHPTEDALLSTRTAVGAELLAAGRREAALEWFDRAAGVVESTARRLPLDGDRGRFRAANRAPYDGALRALLAGPASGERLEEVLRWAQRRASAQLGPTAAEPLALRQLQRRLSREEGLVAYLAVEERLWALVVTRKAAEILSLDPLPGEMASLVERVRAPMEAVHGGVLDLARAHFDAEAAAALHRGLLAPLGRLLAGVERLWVVPDGPLHLLPFDALVPAPGRFLMDEVEVVLLPSPRYLPPPGRGSPRPGRWLAVGYQAPGDSVELVRLQAAVGEREVTVLRGARATEAALARLAPGAEVLHVAAHARADPLDPLASYLRLAPGDGQDGLLHAQEIAAGTPGPRLVVLSGCETLRGPLYEGEGLMGLARAFQAAGSEWVVATSWPVGPSAASLMGAFYARLAAGDDPPRALRAAKAEMQGRPETAHPFHWAGFTVVAAG